MRTRLSQTSAPLNKVDKNASSQCGKIHKKVKTRLDVLGTNVPPQMTNAHKEATVKPGKQDQVDTVNSITV
jgi:hypothetical protein